jgi:hypothetical protein
MKQKIIGVYYAGFHQIQLVLREGTGGEFYLIPESGSIPRIKIGGDYSEWREVINCLTHELDEFLYDKIQCRYVAFDNLSNSHDQYLFNFTHAKFSDCKMKAAEFLAEALPDLATAWKQWKKDNKK